MIDPTIRDQIARLPRHWAVVSIDADLLVEPGVNATMVKLSDVLALLDQAAVSAPGVIAWQSVAEVEPPDDTYCLVWTKWPGDVRVYKCELRQRPRVTWQGLYGWEPTHWALLPSGPYAAGGDPSSLPPPEKV